MKLIATLLLAATAAFAQELKPIAAPDLKSPLPAEWKIAKGTWEVRDGVLTGAADRGLRIERGGHDGEASASESRLRAPDGKCPALPCGEVE